MFMLGCAYLCAKIMINEVWALSRIPAAIIQGAVETYMAESPVFAPLISSTVTAALGEERVRELRGRGANMDWDQVVAYTLAQTTQALNELQPETQP